MHSINVLIARAKDILQTEGLIGLARRGVSFWVYYSFRYGKFYLYKHKHDILKERNEADFMPRITNFTFKIVSTHKQADELAASTGFDFRQYFINARPALDKGAIAFCIFVDRELAHIGWVALTEEARKFVDSLPYRVDFDNKEACTGSTETIPKYRGNGLMAYGYFKRFQYLKERGDNSLPKCREYQQYHISKGTCQVWPSDIR